MATSGEQRSAAKPSLFLVLLFVPAVITTAPALRTMMAEAAAWRPRPDPIVEEIRARVPETGSVDIVLLTPEGRESAVFAGAALAPRDVRFFEGWEAWRARRRAIFMRDDRAVNAPPGPPPGPATLVVPWR